MGDDSREDNVYMAKLSEQAERFDDMVMYMKKICADKGGALEMEERNILSVAFKNVISAHRSSVRIMRAAEKKEIDKDSDKAVFASQYRAKVEEELQIIILRPLMLLIMWIFQAQELKLRVEMIIHR